MARTCSTSSSLASNPRAMINYSCELGRCEWGGVNGAYLLDLVLLGVEALANQTDGEPAEEETARGGLA